jgi:hypothetical protein
MKLALPASILVSAVALVDQSAHAREPGQYKLHETPRTSFTAAATTKGQRPISSMDLTPRKPLVRPYGDGGAAPAEDRVPIAVSYRMSPDGPVGSVGIVEFASSHALDPSLMSNAVANQPGAPSQTIGAQLAYNFH